MDGGEKPRGPRGRDVVLLCNPLAGGRWRALAEVLDSPEAKAVRRIVTDEIDDVGAALRDVGRLPKLICVYGGDGTIYNVINQLLHDIVPAGSHTLPRLALLGGGTMNVTPHLCGMTGSPGENFRAVMHAYLADELRWRDVPVLSVKQGNTTRFGFTFGLGPLVRVLDQYERGQKGKLAAVRIGLRAIAAACSPLRTELSGILDQLFARVQADEEHLPYENFSAVFANTTGAIQRLVEPFVEGRTRDTFHFLAYAVSPREMALLVPMLMRGKLPVDRNALLSPKMLAKALGSLGSPDALPRDPRYVNRPAQRLRIETTEPLYTLDGEVLETVPGRPLEVSMGPSLQLATRETV